MNDGLRIVVIVLLLAIVGSLGSALFQLARGGDSKKMVRALSLRVGLSIGLFLLLMISYWVGWITPNGVGR
ncbi:MAG: twin transmembrane helix small protein [Steroidobacteraceae bacterium]